MFPVAIEFDEPIYVAIVTPAIHYTMGGLKIDKQVNLFSVTSLLVSHATPFAYRQWILLHLPYHLPCYYSKM